MHNNTVFERNYTEVEFKDSRWRCSFFSYCDHLQHTRTKCYHSKFHQHFWVYEVDRHDITLVLIISIELNLTFKKLKYYLSHSAEINSFSSILIFRAGNAVLVDMFTQKRPQGNFPHRIFSCRKWANTGWDRCGAHRTQNAWRKLGTTALPGRLRVVAAPELPPKELSRRPVLSRLADRDSFFHSNVAQQKGLKSFCLRVALLHECRNTALLPMIPVQKPRNVK